MLLLKDDLVQAGSCVQLMTEEFLSGRSTAAGVNKQSMFRMSITVHLFQLA